MSDVRYQVFVSSTFKDLIDARSKVQRVLLEMNCIPAGMELFPSADEEQFEFIKKVIDDCDYYVLLIAGRYGSTTAEGVSYTEKEFEYAVQKGLPILAFLHGDPQSIPFGQSELDQTARERLEAFRKRVSTDRLIKQWKTADELAAQVVLSLSAAIKTNPGRGWVRGPQADVTGMLERIAQLEHDKSALYAQVIQQQPQGKIATLAKAGETFTLKGTGSYGGWSIQLSWNDMLTYVGPSLLQWTNDETVNHELARAAIHHHKGQDWSIASVDAELFKTVRIQFMALGWVEVNSKTTVASTVDLFWRLTISGKQQMIELRSVKTATNPEK